MVGKENAVSENENRKTVIGKKMKNTVTDKQNR